MKIKEFLALIKKSKQLTVTADSVLKALQICKKYYQEDTNNLLYILHSTGRLALGVKLEIINSITEEDMKDLLNCGELVEFHMENVETDKKFWNYHENEIARHKDRIFAEINDENLSSFLILFDL